MVARSIIEKKDFHAGVLERPELTCYVTLSYFSEALRCLISHYYVSSVPCYLILYVKLTGFACVLELLAEPLYILSQNLLLLKLRLMVETTATIVRCMTTYILIIRQPNMVIA